MLIMHEACGKIADLSVKNGTWRKLLLDAVQNKVPASEADRREGYPWLMHVTKLSAGDRP